MAGEDRFTSGGGGSSGGSSSDTGSGDSGSDYTISLPPELTGGDDSDSGSSGGSYNDDPDENIGRSPGGSSSGPSSSGSSSGSSPSGSSGGSFNDDPEEHVNRPPEDDSSGYSSGGSYTDDPDENVGREPDDEPEVSLPEDVTSGDSSPDPSDRKLHEAADRINREQSYGPPSGASTGGGSGVSRDRMGGTYSSVHERRRAEQIASREDNLELQDIASVEDDGTVNLTEAARRRRAGQSIVESTELGPNDIRRVERTEDGGWSATLTPSAEERRARKRFEENRETRRRAARLNDATPSEPRGVHSFSVDQMVFDATEDGVTVRPEEDAVRRRSRRAAVSELEEAYGVDLEAGEDVQVEDTDESTRASLTRMGRARVRGEGSEETAGVDADVAFRLPEQVAGVGVPFGGERVETAMAYGSEVYGDYVDRQVARTTPEGSRQMAASFDVESEYDAINAPADSFYGSALQVANVPETAMGIKEAAEEPVAESRAARQGDGLEFERARAKQATDAAGAAVDYARENPGKAAAATAGSLLASGAIMGGASAASGKLGTASRYAIQPGEELVGSAGHRATRRISGQKRADQLFPDKEPLFMSEEFAIRQAGRAYDKVRGAGGTAKGVVRGVRYTEPGSTPADMPSGATELGELGPTLNVERAQRFRPGAPGAEVTAEGEPMGSTAPPEPGAELGADQSALDVTTGIEPTSRTEERRRARRAAETAYRERRRAEEASEFMSIEARRARRPPEGQTLDEIALQAQDADAWNAMVDELGVTPRTGGGLDTQAQARGQDYMDDALSRIDEAQQLESELRERGQEDYLSLAEQTGGMEARGRFEERYGRERMDRARAEERARVFSGADTEQETGRPGFRVEGPLAVPGFRSAPSRRSGTSMELGVERFTTGDSELELEQEQEAEAQNELSLAMEQEMEAESELEARAEAEYEAEVEPGVGRRRKQGAEHSRRRPGWASRSGGRDELAIGWAGETVAGFAGLGIAGGGGLEVSRPELEAQGDVAFGEYAPSFSGEEASEFEEAADMLTFGDGGGDGWP